MTIGSRIKIFFNFLILSCACFLTACNEQQIVQDLSQKQAQEIVTVLAEQGIGSSVNKEKGGRSRFAVAVSGSNYTEAVSILHYNSLPKAQEPGLSDILESRGFLPNSKELESLRVERALASELEAMIKVMPSVQEVKAVVRRSVISGMGPPAPTQLSVLITSNNPSELNPDMLRALIVNLVQGVTEQSMVIDIQEARQQISSDRQGILKSSEGKKISVPIRNVLGWFRIASDDYDKLILSMSVILTVFLLVGIILGFFFGFLGRKVVSVKGSENFVALNNDKTTLALGRGATGAGE